MKRLILTSAVLLVSLMTQAQTKMAAKLTNGFKAVYTEEQTVETGGTAFTIASEEEYAVSNVTPTGAVITVTTTKVTSDAKEMQAQLVLMPIQMMKGISVRLATDADGKVKNILNGDEVRKAAKAKLGTLVDKFLADNEEVAQMLSKDMLIEQVSSRLEDNETLLEAIKESGVLKLNGKQLSNGATEKVEQEGLRLKSMYFVMGKNVVVNTSLDMTKDELKTVIIKKVEEEAPEQAEIVKENIDMLMGQMKFEMTAKSTITLGDNGWPTSIKKEMSSDIMGQSSKQTSVIKLVKN